MSNISAAHQDSWKKCLEFIKNNIGPSPFATWFAPIVFGGMRGKSVVLHVPSHFFYEYVEENFKNVLCASVRREFGEGTGVSYKIVMDTGAGSGVIVAAPPVADKPKPETGANKTPGFIDGLVGETPQSLDPRLNPAQTFDSFIESDSNKLPRSIGMSIADNPGQMTFNPLFVYGQSGVGKTHLVNAIGNAIRQKHPSKRVLYVSAHLFLVQYGDASRRNLRNDFIHFYQSVDVLIIDDIQELAGESRKGTQEAFFHIFNHLQQTRHTLIMTSDRPPVELEGIEERLLTRFKWGLVAELHKPDEKLARKILQSKMRRDGLSFPREVTDYIARNASGNIRDLEGVMTAILAYSVVYDSEVDMELTRRVVARSVRQKGRSVSVERVLNRVSGFYNIPVKDICSSSRKQIVALARQVSMYLVQKHTGMSYSRIGNAIGKRDHSTVMHSCSVVERRISHDRNFRKDLENIEAGL